MRRSRAISGHSTAVDGMTAKKQQSQENKAKPVERVNFHEDDVVDEHVRRAVKRGVAKNKHLKNPLPEQVGDEIRIIPPEELPDEGHGPECH